MMGKTYFSRWTDLEGNQTSLLFVLQIFAHGVSTNKGVPGPEAERQHIMVEMERNLKTFQVQETKICRCEMIIRYYIV